MVNIPMTAKKPMRTSELEGINRTTPQTLFPNRAGQSAPPPNHARSSPPPSPPPNRTGSTPPPPRPAPRRPHPPASGAVLQKGQKTSLDPGLDLIEVGLGWELGPKGQGYDLDVEAFLLNGSGKVLGDSWFVFYNQPVSPDGSVRLLEHSAPGAAPSDDEVIQVRLRQVNPGVTRIVFILTINEALTYGYNFSNVANAYVRIVDRSTRRELARFQLTDYYSTVCSMMVGELYRYKNEWRFNPVGNGTGDDLAGLCTRYGVDV